MRFRLGVAVGFGVGYYLGAKAGRQRYEQLERWIDRARQSDVVETAAEKAKAVADLGVERARDLVDRQGRDVTDPAIDVRVGDDGAVQSGLPRPGSQPPNPSPS